jgi:hypothetical protein
MPLLFGTSRGCSSHRPRQGKLTRSVEQWAESVTNRQNETETSSVAFDFPELSRPGWMTRRRRRGPFLFYRVYIFDESLCFPTPVGPFSYFARDKLMTMKDVDLIL